MSSNQQRFSLVFVHGQGQVLLGLKKRGFATGKWNGFGGKLEQGETMDACARRELQEESLLTAIDIGRVGNAVIHRDRGPMSDTIAIDIYTCTRWSGEPAETDEMRPQWYSYADIPYDLMWAEAAIYLPRILRGERLSMELWYDDWDGQGGQLVKHVVQGLL